MDDDTYDYEPDYEPADTCSTCQRLDAECEDGRRGKLACGMYLSGE